MFDAGLQDAQRKVQAAGLLHPTASPSNMEGRGIKAMLDSCATPAEAEREREETIKPIMDLQRSVMRGEGLWEWMNHHPEDIVEKMKDVSLEDSAPRQLIALPSTNLMGNLPPALADAIVAQALPEDRQRFRNYLSNLFLGVGIITAVSSLVLWSFVELLNG